MKRLTVLRHAKSSWDDPGLDDFNRPLNQRGWKAAQRMGRQLEARRMRFDLVLASTAARVRETIDGLGEKYDFGAPIRFEPRIYMASFDELLDLIQAIPDDVNSALLVGHNPGMEQLVTTLTRDDKDNLRERASEKFPTAALAAIELEIRSWSELEPGAGQIVELILPRELAD